MLYVILIWYGGYEQRIFNNVWFLPAFVKRDKKAQNDSFPSNPDKLVWKPVMSLQKAYKTAALFIRFIMHMYWIHPTNGRLSFFLCKSVFLRLFVIGPRNQVFEPLVIQQVLFSDTIYTTR